MAKMNVYTLEEYSKLKKKKKNGIEDAITYEDPEEIKSRSVITLEEHMKMNGISLDNLSGDIAPVRSLTDSTKEEKEKKKEKESKLDFFQKGSFSDGYQIGDVTKAILGTTGDAGVGIVKGIAGLGEGIVDLARYGVAGAAGAFGADNYAEQVKKKAQKNSVENFFKGTDEYLNQYSVLGRTSDAIMQGIGQVGGILATGGAAGALGASGGVATGITTGVMGLSSTGSGMSEAYQGNATDKEALMYGISKGVIDAGSELLFGGLGKTVNAVGLSKGISSLDDVFAQKLSSKVSNQVAKNFAEFGVKASAEGFEEVLAGAGSAVAKKLTYMEEEELQDLLADENLLEQFVVGTVTSGMIQSGYIPGTAQGSLKESNKTERDFITGYTQNEQAIIDKEVEARTEGKNLTKKEIGKIEEEVKKDLEKGYISTDTIESALGGDTYNAYNSLLEESKEFDTLYNMESGKLSRQQQNRLNELEEKNKAKPYQTELSSLKEKLSKEVKATTEKDTFLLESYNEKARRSQAYEADLTKYDEKQQEIIKNAAESGILNNTKRTHEFVDMIAKISADKGVSFDFTNNAKLKETGFAMEGKTVNGYIKDGNIAVNIDSNKALNTVVGHEITHVLEGSDLYAELQNVVKEYATTKGEYQTRYDALVDLYKDVDGAVIENELTADLVGEYLFTDSDFINNLSTNKPNVFKKIYEEIKYLYKLATAGSKEARELEKVKRAFDKAYKTSNTNAVVNDVDFSLVGKENGIEVYETSEAAKELSYNERKQKLLDTMKNEFAGRTAKFIKNGEAYYAFYNKDGISKGVYGDKKSDKKGYKAKVNIGADGNYIELAENSLYQSSSEEQGKNNRFHRNAKEWDYYVKTIKSDGNYYDVLINVKNTGDKQFVYDITLKEAVSLPDTENVSYAGNFTASDNSIPENTKNTSAGKDARYSLSEDSEGNSVSPAVQKRFSNSKAVDENGSLKVLYHGTPSGDFTIFDKSKGSIEGDFGSGFYFTDNEADVETNYEGGGPDFENKVARRAEQIEAEEDIDYDEAEQRAREELYKGSNKFEVYLNIENPAIVGETTLLSQEDFMDQYNEEDFDDYDEYIAEVEQFVSDEIENIVWEVEKNVDLYSTDGIADVLFNAYYEGGIGIEELKAQINELYLEDNEGNLAGNEVTRQIIESLGYDGIIDNTVSDKFSNMGLDSGTTHYIVFKPNQIKSITNQNPTDNPDINLSLSGNNNNIAPVGNYRVYGKDIALEQPENVENITENTKNSEKISEIAPENTDFENYAPLTEEEANERDAMQGDRLYDLNDYDMPEEVEASYYGDPAEAAEPAEAVSPFDEKDIQEVGNRKQKAYMYENPEVKPYFQEEALVMLGELQRSVKGEKHFNDQLYYDTNGEQGWYGTKRETSEQIAYMLDRFKYTYADIEKGLNAIIEDHGAENNAISKRLEFMLDERLREGYTDFGSNYEIPPNQDYINLLSEKQITEYTDEAYNRYLESLAYAEAPAEMAEAPIDETQVLYSLEAEQQEKIEEIDSAVDTEDAERPEELPTIESFDTKLENYKTALEGYKNVKSTMDAAFDEAINKKTAEYEALKRKDTKRASDLLIQIENLKLRKSNNATKIDSKIAKVEATIDKLSNGIPTKRQIYHRNIVDKIKNAFSTKGLDFDKVLENAKNKGTFSSVDNTPQRFIEKSLGYKEGQILNDLTVNKIAQNESKAIQWINSFTDKKGGLLANISKEYGIKPRSKESAAAQMYAEGFWVDDNGNFIKYGDNELAKDFPNQKTRENIKKLAKDERIRKIYDDTLNSINESRKRNLYPEIPRRKNYFLHFREMEDTFSKLGIPFNPNDIKLKDLPTDINGMTADLKPGQPYFASAKQRLGYKTTYDLIGGVERYLNSAKNQIYHIDDIQTLRALRNYIADIYGQAHGLENLDSMTEEEAAARVEEVYNSHLSTFAKFLNEEANVIAGKTSLTDRGLEGVIGRRGIQFLDTVNRQVGSNMVGGNISSALTNTVSVVQAVAKTNKFDAVKAFAQTASNLLGSIVGKTDGFVDKNPMMIRRKGIERMTRTPWESITDKGYLLMGVIDNISSEFIARTKFNELTRKGMSEEQAHIEADKWGSKLLGDRSLGQQPQLYNSKMLGLITKFQLEVRNQLDSQFYDTIQEAKLSNEEIENKLLRNAKTAAKVGSTFFQLAVLQHLFGKAFESVAGYNPTFDIVEALMQVLGLDDEEESEDTVLDNMEEGFLTLLGDLPYTSTFTGGRIPISSALPVKQFITGKDSYGNEKSRLETIKETAPYYFAPTGYGQIKKTMQGLEMFNEEHPVAGSYTKSGNLRFPIEDTPANRLQAGIFGQYANENARDYFDNERSPLKEKQIQEYKDLDLPIRDYWDYREGLADQNTLEDKFDYIAGLDLPVEKKNIMINNIVDRKESIDMTNYDEFGTLEEFDYATKNPEKYNFLQENNISYQEYSGSKESKELYNWYYDNPTNLTMAKVVTNDLETYRSYTKELGQIKADKDANGKTISGSRKEKVLNYINGLSANFGEKAILFKKEYPSDDTYNNEIIDYLNSRGDISYEETATILRELGFTVSGDGTVSW